jgi:tetratricopeptide (TPR) repeat protein
MLSHQSIDPNARPKAFLLWRPWIALWHWIKPPTQAHADRESAPVRWLRVLFLLVICFGLMTLSILYARPIYRSVQEWRATRMAQQARSLADQGEVFQAVNLAQKAYLIAPENTTAIRVNAEFFTLIKRQEALYFWEKLQKKNDFTPQDQQLYTRALIDANREKEAKQLLEQSLASQPADEETIQLARILFGREGLSDTVIPRLAEFTDSNPDDLWSQLRLAQLRFEHGKTRDRDLGLKILFSIAHQDSNLGQHALDYLITLPTLAPEEDQKLIDIIRRHPAAKPPHRIEAYRRLLKANPAAHNSLILEAMETFKDEKRENLVPLARWLIEAGAPQQLLTIIPEPEAKAYQPLLEHYLTALTLLNRMDDLQRIVTDPEVERLISRATSSFYKLHLAFILKQPVSQMRPLMQNAVRHAEQEGRAEILIAIGKYGEERSLADLSTQAYEAALHSRRTRTTAIEGLLRCTRITGNTAAHIRALTEAINTAPDNTTYQEQLLYAQLLTGQNMETAQERALQIATANQQNDLARLLIAMAWWRLRAADRITPAIQNMNLSKLTHGQQAVYAALAQNQGFTKEARQIANAIPPDATMFPEERQLFLLARTAEQD